MKKFGIFYIVKHYLISGNHGWVSLIHKIWANPKQANWKINEICPRTVIGARFACNVSSPRR